MPLFLVILAIINLCVRVITAATHANGAVSTETTLNKIPPNPENLQTVSMLYELLVFDEYLSMVCYVDCRC